MTQITPAQLAREAAGYVIARDPAFDPAGIDGLAEAIEKGNIPGLVWLYVNAERGIRVHQAKIIELERQVESLRRESGDYLTGCNMYRVELDAIAKHYIRHYPNSGSDPKLWVITYPDRAIIEIALLPRVFYNELEAIRAWRLACGLDDCEPIKPTGDRS